MPAIEFIARLDLKHDDAELERKYEEYKNAKAALMAYLYREGLQPSIKQKETASGN